MQPSQPGASPTFLGFVFNAGLDGVVVPVDGLTVLYGRNGAGKSITLAAVQDFYSGMGATHGADPPAALVQLAAAESETNMSWWPRNRGDVRRRSDYGSSEGESELLAWVRDSLRYWRHTIWGADTTRDEHYDALVREWSRQRLVMLAASGRARQEWLSLPVLMTSSSSPTVAMEVAHIEQDASRPRPDQKASSLVQARLPGGDLLIELAGLPLSGTQAPLAPYVARHSILPNIGMFLEPEFEELGQQTAIRLRWHADFRDLEQFEVDAAAERIRLSDDLQELADAVEQLAADLYQSALEGPPVLTLRTTMSGWDAGVRWLADGRSLSQLSFAEERWARWAINQALIEVLPMNSDFPSEWIPGAGIDPDPWSIGPSTFHSPRHRCASPTSPSAGFIALARAEWPNT